jgi:hypothetical protein
MSNPLSLTFIRPSTTNYVASNGVTLTANANTPAYGFDSNGVALGSKWTSDTVAFSNTASNYVGQTRGTVRLDFNAPSSDTLFVINSSISIPAGNNSLIIEYRPSQYRITLNGVVGNNVNGNYNFTNMSLLEIGNFGGVMNADGYFFRRLSTKELD